MRFARIHNAVHFQPWLIRPSFHASIVSLLKPKMEGQPTAERPTEDMFGNPLPVMQIENGIAIIPVCGVIGKGMGMLEKSCGAVGVEDVSADLKKAVADRSVAKILLHIDSPGGTVSGVPELAKEVAAVSRVKPVMSFTDGMMCSAAYWIAAGSTAIYASESADVGSIGVYLPWIDQTAAYAMEGYKVELIKNKESTFKGAGFPGTALTDDQRKELQSGVDQIFAMFSGAILSSRKVPNESMRGQTFMGEEAVASGLVDSIASFETAVRDLAKMRVS